MPSVTVLELPATWGSPARALDGLERLLDAPGAPLGELVLLPEGCIHGYVSPAGDFDMTFAAETIDGPTATRCGEIASARGIRLVASLVLREERAVYNAMVGFSSEGVEFVYRKRHPWIPEVWATAGVEPAPLIAMGNGGTATIAICYDVHFLGRDSKRQLEAADVLLFPSAWVEDPDRRHERLVALARRYGVHVANANWGPGVVRVPGQGGTCIVAPDGSIRVGTRVDL